VEKREVMANERVLTPSNPLYQHLSGLRWLALAFGLIVVMLHQFLEGIVRSYALPRWEQIEIVYGILISLVTWSVLTWLRRSVWQTETAKHALDQTLAELNQANQHLEFILQVNRRLTEAEDDTSLVEIIVNLFMDVAPTAACSLIRFDSRGRSLPAVYRGENNPIVVDKQMAHLSKDEVRQQCEECAQKWSDGKNSCALFAPSVDGSAVQKMHCLQLVRGSRVYGTVSLYLNDPSYPNDQDRLLLEMMVNEITLAMESHALRAREMAMLNRLQEARRMSNLNDGLAGTLTGTVEAMRVAGGALFLVNESTSELHLQTEAGRLLGDSLYLIKGLAEGAGQAETPFVISDLAQDNGSEALSLLIAPLRVGERNLGSLILWTIQPDTFTQRQAQLVTTVAGQTALLIENHRLYLRSEHRIVLEERARLAREIHDGLAQTLGYLKLRAAQLDNWLEYGDDRQVKIGLDQLQQLLGEAYANTREAIDGLRLTSPESDLQAWINEIASEFEALSGVPVSVSSAPEVSLLPEVQVQLQRIVQEAFSNIRKHADATRAWLEWRQDDYWLTLLIKDNGCGFDLNDIPLMQRHGLRIMLERADLLDADFQVASQEDEGTQIIVRLPLNVTVTEVQVE